MWAHTFLLVSTQIHFPTGHACQRNSSPDPRGKALQRLVTIASNTIECTETKFDHSKTLYLIKRLICQNVSFFVCSFVSFKQCIYQYDCFYFITEGYSLAKTSGTQNEPYFTPESLTKRAFFQMGSSIHKVSIFKPLLLSSFYRPGTVVSTLQWLFHLIFTTIRVKYCIHSKLLNT